MFSRYSGKTKRHWQNISSGGVTMRVGIYKPYYMKNDWWNGTYRSQKNMNLVMVTFLKYMFILSLYLHLYLYLPISSISITIPVSIYVICLYLHLINGREDVLYLVPTGRTGQVVGRQMFQLHIVGPLYPSEVINGKAFFK